MVLGVGRVWLEEIEDGGDGIDGREIKVL